MTEVISKNVLTDLFQLSVVYHRRRLRELFRKYYNPLQTDVVWTKDLSDNVINDLRLHLSWDLGMRTFNWSKEVVGTRIMCRFKEIGMLLFLKKVILDDQNTT